MIKKTLAKVSLLIFLILLISILAQPAEAINIWYTEEIMSGREYLMDLDYDQAENPSIVTFNYDTYEVKYVYKTSTGWQKELIDIGTMRSTPVLEYSPTTGVPSVLYIGSDGALKYAVRTGEDNWTISTVQEPYDGYIDGEVSLAFNSSGQPSVSFILSVSPEFNLYYASFDGTSWRKKYLDSVLDIGYPYLAFNNDNPAIAYSGGDEGLKYAYYNAHSEAWGIETVDPLGSDYYRSRQIYITMDFGKGTPHISYYDQETEDLKYAYKSGSSWNVQTLESSGDVGLQASIQISETAADYMIYITYVNFVNHENTSIKLKSKSNTDSDFSTQTVYTKDFSNIPPILSTDLLDGNPSIAYFDYWASKTKLISMQPDILSVSKVAFGAVNSGSSNTQTITITNNGSTFLAINQIVLPSAPYSITGSLGTGLSSGESKTLEISFNPTNTGTTYNSNLTIHSNDPDEKSYSIPLTGRTFSDNANLSGLTINAESSLIFDSSTTLFATTVANDINSIRITPTAAESHASIKVNEMVVQSGSASQEIPLTIGKNSISVLVTAEDGNIQKTYTLEVTRKDSPNAKLSELSVSGGVLTPGFSPDIEAYSLTLENTDSITITPTSEESRSVITINGEAIDSGASTTKPIEIGANTLTIRVLAPDKETYKNYSLTVYRAPDLADLSLSEGIFNTPFDPKLQSYNSTVPTSVTHITLIPAAAEGIKIKVNGNWVESGSASPEIALQEGNNTITVEAISADGEVIKPYTLNINRLTSLTSLSVGEETIGIASNTFDYDVTTIASSTSIKAFAPDGMSVKINGVLVESGAESSEIALQVGKNTVSIEVLSTECDGSTTYNITIRRLPLLTSLLVDGQTVHINPEESVYTVNVPNTTERAVITPLANEGIIVDVSTNLPSEKGGESWEITLHEGTNLITIYTMSSDMEAFNSYIIIINRLPGLSDLSIDTGALNPSFDTNTMQYNVSLSNNYSTITLTAVATNLDSRIAINGIENIGTHSEEINLLTGNNDIEIIVTSSDGQVVSTYNINVFRAYPPSDDDPTPDNNPPSNDDSTPDNNPPSDDDSTPDNNPPSNDDSAPDNNQPEYEAEVEGTGLNITLPISINNTTRNAMISIDNFLIGSSDTSDETVGVNMPSITGIDEYTLEMPTSILTNIVKDHLLTLTTEIGSITITDNMLSESLETQGKKASITIGQGDKAVLTDEARTAIGNRPIIQLTMTIDGEKVEWENTDSPVIVSIPYSPTEEELSDSEHIVIWYIDGSGNIVSIPNGRYDSETGMVTFSTTHFSYYAVTYVKKSFDDITNIEWARKPIEVMASKGIINGTSENSFSPKENITRADFLVLLMRTLGFETEVNDNFDDVKKEDYYYDAIGTAKSLGITTGIGNNLFNPSGYITRQEMFVMTARALEILKGVELSSDSNALNQFLDEGDIAKYAKEDIAALVEEGIILGSGDTINPLSPTTRAEAAVFLYRIYCNY